MSLTAPRRLRTRTAGVFLFLPLLAKLGFDAPIMEELARVSAELEQLAR